MATIEEPAADQRGYRTLTIIVVLMFALIPATVFVTLKVERRRALEQKLEQSLARSEDLTLRIDAVNSRIDGLMLCEAPK